MLKIKYQKAKILFNLIYSTYIAIIFGFFIHTSKNAVILYKYSFQYFIFLILLILFSLLFFLFYINKKYKHLFLFFILILVISVAFEAYLRNKFHNTETNQYKYTIENYHPFLQFKISSNYTTNVNNYGFRGENINLNKPKGTYRIFLLGGSTVLNRNIEYKKTFGHILEKLLENTNSKKIEVINAGVDGYTTEHSIIQYLFYVKKFDPDLIIMWHGINDWYYGCDQQKYSVNMYKIDYSHYLGSSTRMVKSYFQPEQPIKVKLLIVDKVYEFFSINWYSDILNKKNTTDYLNSENTYDLRNNQSLNEYKINLETIIKILKSDNVKLILSNQAYLYKLKLNKEEQNKILFPMVQCTNAQGKYPSIKSTITTLDQYNKTAKRISEITGTYFLDLEELMPKNLNYFTDDVHYTEKGNEKIAHLFFSYIIKGNIINK